MKAFLAMAIASFMSLGSFAQDLSSKQIIEKADNKLKGLTSKSEMKITIVRPKWSRTMEIKNWTKGDEFSFTLVTAPAKEEGTVFLKRGNEIWNWVPSIERSIKLPPSMMMQSWMGTDMTNDDLVKQSSMVTDYKHTRLADETIEGRDCYHLELIPKEDAAVIWGKIVIWIDKEDFMQLKVEFYDEEEFLINIMTASEITELGGKTLPRILEMIPVEKEGHKTIMEYKSIEFDQPLEDSFFSIQNMKRLK